MLWCPLFRLLSALVGGSAFYFQFVKKWSSCSADKSSPLVMESQVYRVGFLVLIWLQSIFIYLPTTWATTNVEQPEMMPFSTKTAYQASFVYTGRRLAKLYYPDWCVPIQVNAVIRHGIRNPGDKDIESFKSLVGAIELDRGNTLHRVMELMLQTVEAHKPKSLLEDGKTEQMLLGSRFAEQFPSLFAKAQFNDIRFVASTSERTVDSCEAFQKGMLKHNLTFSSEIEINDNIIRFFDTCEKYISDVEENKMALGQYHLFKDLHYYTIADNIRSQLSANYISDLHKRLKALYVMSGIEQAVKGSRHLAAVFTQEDLLRMEYAADLKNYWKKSYGHPINFEQSCPLLEDVLEGLQDASMNNGSYKGVFRFAHAETLLPLMALLGLHKDATPLRADNYEEHRDRAFRTSHVMPFTSNLAFVLYRCRPPPDGASSRASRDWPTKWAPHMVQFLLKEQPHPLPGWNTSWCPLETLLDHYRATLAACDLGKLCSTTAGPLTHDDL